MQPEINIDDLLAANVRRAAGPSCTVCIALASLSDDMRAKLDAAVANRNTYTSRGLVTVINALVVEELHVTRSAVDRHRNRECKAGRTNG